MIMNNRKSRFRTPLLVLAAMAFIFPRMTSCEWFFDVDFNIGNPATKRKILTD